MKSRRPSWPQQYFDQRHVLLELGHLCLEGRQQTILDALARYQPEMFAHLKVDRRGARPVGLRGRARARICRDPARFDRLCRHGAAVAADSSCRRPSGKVLVIERPVRVGRRRQLAGHRPAQSGRRTQGNVIQGRHVGLATRGTIVRTDDQHLVATLGIEDCIVVHTPKATLVANKHDEESIRQLIKLIEERGWHEYL